VDVVEVSAAIASDAGAFALWDVAAFRQVVDYDSWERELLEDDSVARHVAAGHLVPVTIGSDGAFQMLVRIGGAGGAARLSDRESRYRLISSEPYLFEVSGRVRLSGIEHISGEPSRGLEVPMPDGQWDVTVHLIEWDAEPGAKDSNGEPASSALPDFVVLVDPANDDGQPRRLSVQTFAPPSA
jgi:hypothetical protein